MVKVFNNVGRKRGNTKLSPTARSAEEIRTQHPMFQYAINEYAQTSTVGTQNDDGHKYDSSTSSWTGYDDLLDIPPAPSGLPGARSTVSNDPVHQQHQQQEFPHQQQQQFPHQQQQQHFPHHHQHQHQHPPPPPPQPMPIRTSDRDSVHASASDIHTNFSSNHAMHHSVRSHFEAEMPDASYEEYYGDAYTGQPMKYIYPSGYQSMRPRSCPWKLSIIVCILFTWLSIFIVGHCSTVTQYRNNEIDDDSLVMDIRWCGSRPLYLMWVCSMLITGVAAAYCSVIGYIKVRDFAVANSRSQPPGVVDSKSDFYVQIEDGIVQAPSEDTSVDYYRKTIYQSDGTPQFWGAHIYKPTQAAVAITSR
jgi:hypothetical protein